jgi:3-dehydroquinate synthase
MSEDERVRVELGGRSYDIVVGSGLLARAGQELAKVMPRPDAIIVTDSNLAATGHLEVLEQSLDAAAIARRTIALPPGEAAKSMARLGELLDRILDLGAERSTTIVAFGGGVIGDLAGFAAAIVLRGLDCIQIPTTLLAQVDSAIGGKTGINTRHGKNLVGAFHQPRLVLADPAVLASLPPRELRAGYAEVLKYGLIDRPDFFAWLEAHGKQVLAGKPAAQQHAVLESCRAKAAVVAADEREAAARALLNFGHTFAHALEAITGYSEALLHGEAVALGMVLAFELSVRLRLCPPDDAMRVRAHLAAVGLPTSRRMIRGVEFPTHALLAAMGHDKKAQGGRPRFVLTRGIGRVFAGAGVETAELERLLDAVT